MLLRNLSLALGIITASAVGAVVGIQRYKPPVKVIIEKEISESDCPKNDGKIFLPLILMISYYVTFILQMI
jgi:hypothetical protein